MYAYFKMLKIKFLLLLQQKVLLEKHTQHSREEKLIYKQHHRKKIDIVQSQNALNIFLKSLNL